MRKVKEGERGKEVADSTFNANQRIARHRELGKLSRVTYPGNETLGLETIFNKSLRRETATRGIKAEKNVSRSRPFFLPPFPSSFSLCLPS